MKRRAAIYARLSVSTEESVSIERQLRSARMYAESRDWTVVLEETDNNVSATLHRPEDRPGWRRILESEAEFEAVIVLRVDRLARKTIDFLHAHEALTARGAAIVAVEDPVDMGTATGKAFATMLAVFAEVEAASISARVGAARRVVVAGGRWPGGPGPFGYQVIPNPVGAGKVLAQDPATIGYVREVVDIVLAGRSLSAACKHLNDRGVMTKPRRPRGAGPDAEPTPKRWAEWSLRKLLSSPVLAGMTAYQGGVIRDERGLPVIREDLAVITVDERARLLLAMEARSRPTGQRNTANSAMLKGLIVCSGCGLPLWRQSSGGVHQYRCGVRWQRSEPCPRRVGVDAPKVEEHVVSTFLERFGDQRRLLVHTAIPDNSAALAEIESAMTFTLDEMRSDGADMTALTTRLMDLKDTREQVLRQAPEQVVSWLPESYSEAWNAAETDEDRQMLLAQRIEKIIISPGVRGRWNPEKRVKIEWKQPITVKAGSTGRVGEPRIVIGPDLLGERTEA